MRQGSGHVKWSDWETKEFVQFQVKRITGRKIGIQDKFLRRKEEEEEE